MKITKRQLRRIISEELNEASTGWKPLSGQHAKELGEKPTAGGSWKSAEGPLLDELSSILDEVEALARSAAIPKEGQTTVARLDKFWEDLQLHFQKRDIK